MIEILVAVLAVLTVTPSPPNDPYVHTINVYQHVGGWAYDDPSRGIYGEELDGGVGILIEQELPGATQANLSFDRRSFFGYQIEADFVESAAGGSLYSADGLTFWLCPHLLDYYTSPPSHIYAEVWP